MAYLRRINSVLLPLAVVIVFTASLAVRSEAAPKASFSISGILSHAQRQAEAALGAQPVGKPSAAPSPSGPARDVRGSSRTEGQRSPAVPIGSSPWSFGGPSRDRVTPAPVIGPQPSGPDKGLGYRTLPVWPDRQPDVRPVTPDRSRVLPPSAPDRGGDSSPDKGLGYRTLPVWPDRQPDVRPVTPDRSRVLPPSAPDRGGDSSPDKGLGYRTLPMWPDRQPDVRPVTPDRSRVLPPSAPDRGGDSKPDKGLGYRTLPVGSDRQPDVRPVTPDRSKILPPTRPDRGQDARPAKPDHGVSRPRDHGQPDRWWESFRQESYRDRYRDWWKDHHKTFNAGFFVSSGSLSVGCSHCGWRYVPPRFYDGYYWYCWPHRRCTYRFGFYVFDFRPSHCYPAPYFFYGYFPYVAHTCVVIVRPVVIPCFVEDRDTYDYYLSSPWVNPALSDIKNAWLRGDVSLIERRVQPYDRIAVYFKKEYSYSVEAQDYLDMTRDAMDQFTTISFQYTRVDRRDENRVTAFARHTYRDSDGDRKTVYVFYTLEREGRDYYIRDVGSSPDPY